MARKVYAGFGQRKQKLATVQTLPVPGREKEQVKNDAGGYVFEMTPFAALERFLILGAETNTYVSGKVALDRNAKSIKECLRTDARKTIDMIVAISQSGRAPKNDPALFALAMATCEEHNPKAANRGYAAAMLPKVARFGTDLFTFVEYAQSMRGWGAILKNAVRAWYLDKPVDNLAFQTIKYQQRNGWSHRDLLRLTHPNVGEDALRNELFSYVVKKEYGGSSNIRIVEGFERAKKASNAKEIVKLITEYNLTREMVPTQFLTELAVWEALLQKMPLMATVRNLPTMTNVGLIKPLSEATKMIVNRLTDANYIRKSRVHPLAMLLAYGTYATGRSQRGSNSWTPVQAITDALMDGFYAAFANVEPTGKNYLIGVDVSGSMGSAWNGTNLRHCEIAAAQAMVIARTEPYCHVMGFARDFVDLGITPKMSLQDVSARTLKMNFGSTDCALPMTYANKNKLDVDAFVVITDNETWAGSIQPFQALRDYRNQRNKPNAKSAVIATAGSNFTIADPKDPGMMDFVGFDANVPVLLADFVGGRRGSGEFDVDIDAEA